MCRKYIKSCMSSQSGYHITLSTITYDSNKHHIIVIDEIILDDSHEFARLQTIRQACVSVVVIVKIYVTMILEKL